MGSQVGALIVLALAIPVGALSLAVAAATWRFVAPPGRALVSLVHDLGEPDTERDRMRYLRRMFTAAFVAFTAGFWAFALASVNEDLLAPSLPVYAPAGVFGLACALLVFLLWPQPASRPGTRGVPAASGVAIRASELPPGWLRAALVVGAPTLVLGLTLCGLVGVKDPGTGRHLALGVPSVMSWRTLADGTASVIYSPGGLTMPWPGWDWALPVIGGSLACAALGVSAVSNLTRQGGPLASGDPQVAAATGRRVLTFGGLLVLAALAVTLGPSLVLVGNALQSVSLIPQPSPDGLNANQVAGWSEPLHTIAVGFTWIGLGLWASALVTSWWCITLIRELGSAERAARTTFTPASVSVSRP